MVSAREERTPSTEGQRPSSRFRRAFGWIGENFATGIVGALAALLVSGVIAFIVADKPPPEQKAAASVHPPKPSPRYVRFDSWPDGVSAYTVILASEATRGLAEAAVEKAKRITSRGLNIGVLRSNDYVSLAPDFWVAFAGQFDSVEEAQQEAERYKSQFSTAYQKFIEQR